MAKEKVKKEKKLSVKDIAKKYNITKQEKVKKQISNIIEPTEEMIKKVLELYCSGSNVFYIRKTVKSEENKSLKIAQIQSIIKEFEKEEVQ